MSAYEFPGNIRELRSMVYNAVAQHRSGGTLSIQSFLDFIQKTDRLPADGKFLSKPIAESSLEITGRFPTLRELDVYLIKEAMRRAADNREVAAMLLGITRRSLNRLLKNMDDN